MIIAGETSGDHHGAKVVEAIRRRDDSLCFCGIGGEALRAAGTEILADASTLSVVGITEVFSKISDILRGMKIAKHALRTVRPDLLILIDFPDFNLLLAGTAKRLGIPVLYYISPQVWAWRSGRVTKIAKLVDHMAVILPFEAAFYRKHKVPVTFVGHPLGEIGENRNLKPGTRNSEFPLVGLLPGSRNSEIAKLLPVMLEAAQVMLSQRGDIKFLISLAPSVSEEIVKDILSRFSLPASHFSFVTGPEEIFGRCSFAIAASGTVTLQTAMAGVPMVVIYKVSPLSYLVGRAMIKVAHICLVNLIAGKEIVPELIQDEASPENISRLALNILNDADRLEKMRNELLGIRKMLGGPGASEQVADIAINMLQRILGNYKI